MIKSLDVKIATLEKANKDLHKEVQEMQQSVLHISLKEALAGINEAKAAGTDDCVDFLISRADTAIQMATKLVSPLPHIHTKHTHNLTQHKKQNKTKNV